MQTSDGTGPVLTSYGGIPRPSGRCLSMHNLYAFLAVKCRAGGEDHNLEQVKSCREGLGAVNKDVFIMYVLYQTFCSIISTFCLIFGAILHDLGVLKASVSRPAIAE